MLDLPTEYILECATLDRLIIFVRLLLDRIEHEVKLVAQLEHGLLVGLVSDRFSDQSPDELDARVGSFLGDTVQPVTIITGLQLRGRALLQLMLFLVGVLDAVAATQRTLHQAHGAEFPEMCVHPTQLQILFGAVIRARESRIFK